MNNFIITANAFDEPWMLVRVITACLADMVIISEAGVLAIMRSSATMVIDTLTGRSQNDRFCNGEKFR